jgi:dihydrofolate reductase
MKKKHIISQIAAMDLNRAIGLKQGLPWHMPADMAYFKAKTKGKPVIMGKNTYLSLGKALPQRPNIVLSRDPNFKPSDALVFSSLPEAILHASRMKEGEDEIFIIGGAQVYEAALPFTDRIYLTLIETKVKEADTYFPVFDEKEFIEISRDSRPADKDNPYPYHFIIYEKKKS